MPRKPSRGLWIQGVLCKKWVAGNPRAERQGMKGSQVGLAPTHTFSGLCVLSFLESLTELELLPAFPTSESFMSS